MAIARKDIGQLLVERGVLNPEDLKTALEVRKQTTQSLERILVDMGFVSEEDVLAARAQLLGVPYVKLSQVPIDPSAVRRFPEHMLKTHNVLPLKMTGNRLTVAMADPSDILAIDDMRMLGYEIEPVLAGEEEITETINKQLGIAVEEVVPATEVGGMSPLKAGAREDISQIADGALEELAQGRAPDADLEEVAETDSIKALAEEAPIIRIVNSLIIQAINDGASDIHVEPQRRNVRIRYRIDGVLHEVMTVPKYVHPPLISRIKIMAELDIAERRLPQDGRIPIRHKGRNYDLRVSVVPSMNGEKAVMRILDQQSVLIGLGKLGLFPDTQAELERLIIQPYGILLSTGPTGAGKTTTQYSILNKINSVEKNIITIEDPIEYQLPGITQVAVNRKAGLTFATALRSFVRQDPDIMMVGEIRDLETADLAVEASLTGHLVLSTLHTNDAPTAITRLNDIGVEPFLIAASLIGVLAQRLVRKICPKCKEPYNPPMEALERLGFEPDPDNPITFYRGRGCEECRHTGFKGRTGIFELMSIDAELAELIVKNASAMELREAARAKGMRTLQEDGLKKVLEGITTIDELIRVVQTVGQVVE
ncbi:MAG TPA: type II secretion system protein GspE [Armatimonadetes bacterium]|nr:type II secretion system protein GspE [Armatimonadota bacterium]